MLLFFFSVNLSAQTDAASSDIEAIKTLIKAHYWNVMYTNEEREEIDVIANGFDPEFRMYVYYQDVLSVRTRDEWMGILQANRDKARDKPKKPKKQNSLEFGFVDVTGQTAVAKLLISSDGQLKYTDYLSLYKMGGEWKVMTKLFTFHQQ